MLGSGIMLVYMLIAERWIFGKTLWSFWAQVLFSLLISALLTIITEYLSLKYVINGWFGLFVAVLFGAIIFTALLILTRYLTLNELLNLKGTFLSKIPKLSESK